MLHPGAYRAQRINLLSWLRVRVLCWLFRLLCHFQQTAQKLSPVYFRPRDFAIWVLVAGFQRNFCFLWLVKLLLQPLCSLSVDVSYYFSKFSGNFAESYLARSENCIEVLLSRNWRHQDFRPIPETDPRFWLACYPANLLRRVKSLRRRISLLQSLIIRQ